MPIPRSWRRCRSAPRPSWTSGSRRRAPRAWTRPRSSPSSGRSSRRSPRAGDRRCLGLPEAPRRSPPRPGRLRRPLRHDGPHRGGCGGALRLQPPPARRLRGDGAHAPRADLRRAAPRLLLRPARRDGLHRPPARPARSALAGARCPARERRLLALPGLAGLAQGQSHLGLPRHHRRAPHRLRPVRVLHGRHARPGGPHPPLQDLRASMIEGLLGLTAMMVLCCLRIPISFAMAMVGFVGYAYMRDWNWAVACATVQTKLYETGRNYTLSVVPLFILMGNFVTRAGMSQELFRAAYAFIGHLRGGLAMATVWASAGFGGICGSSIATAATFAKVAYPSMKRFGYSDRLAAGTVAGAGTLGIMIPPSTIMVIYGVFTETNIGKLFMAGILPGILGAFLLCGAIVYTTWRHPTWGPPGTRSSWTERIAAIRDVWAVAALFFFVMGGIYVGFFTATEGAAMGAFGAMVFALWRRALTWKTLYAALLESARTTSMLFMILIGALIFAEFVNITTMPNDLKGWVTRFNLSPTMVVAAICAIYVVLGTAMEELSMIIIVCVVEIGLISPPVGMNMFVLRTLLPEVSTGTVFSGVLPFMWADVIRLAILVAFPIISLWLPSMMR